MPPDKIPAYQALPPLGSDKRTELIDALADAFGKWDEKSPGAVDPEKVYDILSKLSYHDRITILHQVFRKQGHPSFVSKEKGVAFFGEPERVIWSVLRQRLSTGTYNKPTFVGAMRFLHLMSDAPQDAYHTELLNIALENMKDQTFNDKDNSDVKKPLALVKAYDPGYYCTNDPSKLMRLIGIKQGLPPLRTKDPLGTTDAPQYKALPDDNTKERKELVDQLVKAMGKTSSFTAGKPFPDNLKDGFLMIFPKVDKDFKGMSDPDAFFRLLSQFDYKSRMEIYREVLVARGEEKLALGTDYELRQSLMYRFMFTSDSKKTFAGLDKFFRLVADAPRGRQTDVYLQDEMIVLSLSRQKYDEVPINGEFTDMSDKAVKANFQRFFSIGGQNKEMLPFDFYNRLELIGIPVGKPPVLPTPAKDKEKDVGYLGPFQWDTLGDFPSYYPARGFLGLSPLPELATCSAISINPELGRTHLNVHSPWAHV